MGHIIHVNGLHIAMLALTGAGILIALWHRSRMRRGLEITEDDIGLFLLPFLPHVILQLIAAQMSGPGYLLTAGAFAAAFLALHAIYRRQYRYAWAPFFCGWVAVSAIHCSRGLHVPSEKGILVFTVAAGCLPAVSALVDTCIRWKRAGNTMFTIFNRLFLHTDKMRAWFTTAFARARKLHPLIFPAAIIIWFVLAAFAISRRADVFSNVLLVIFGVVFIRMRACDGLTSLRKYLTFQFVVLSTVILCAAALVEQYMSGLPAIGISTILSYVFWVLCYWIACTYYSLIVEEALARLGNSILSGILTIGTTIINFVCMTGKHFYGNDDSWGSFQLGTNIALVPYILVCLTCILMSNLKEYWRIKYAPAASPDEGAE